MRTQCRSGLGCTHMLVFLHEMQISCGSAAARYRYKLATEGRNTTNLSQQKYYSLRRLKRACDDSYVLRALDVEDTYFRGRLIDMARACTTMHAHARSALS
eukprot:6182174-Pleurochrysis_carterae.AAC.2